VVDITSSYALFTPVKDDNALENCEGLIRAKATNVTIVESIDIIPVTNTKLQPYFPIEATISPIINMIIPTITLPRETSHASLTSEELKRMGIPEGLIRVSVGIEDIDDLIEDFKQAISVC